MFLNILIVVLAVAIPPIYLIASAYERERERVTLVGGDADGQTPPCHSPETIEVTDGDTPPVTESDRSPGTVPVTAGDRVTPGDDGMSREEIQKIFTPLSGITLAEFKRDYCPDGGSILVEKLHDPIVLDIAYSKGFDFLTEYGNTPVEFMVWWVFGLTKKGGDSPGAHRYRLAADFCKKIQTEFYKPNW